MTTKTKKYMKKIYSLLLLIAAAAVSFTSCKDDEPFATASEDDFPQILLPWFGEWENGEPSEYKNFPRNLEYVDSVTVTPARYTTVDWYIDGEKINTGIKCSRYFEAGTYLLKIVATTTKGLETSRTGKLVVRPVDGDPIFSDVSGERLVAPGNKATLTGTNLANVKKLLIGGTEAQISKVSDTQIEYVVPEVADGNYRVEVADASTTYGGIYTSGDSYANMNIFITKTPYVNDAELKAMAGGDVEITGLNLQNVKTITIGDKDATIKSQSNNSLVFTCPTGIAVGEYEVKGTANDGSAVIFNGSSNKISIVEQLETVIYTGPSEKTAWTGIMFGADQIPGLGIKEGSTIIAYLTADEGAIGAIATTWWNKINSGDGWEADGEVIKTNLPAGKCTLEYTVTTMQYLNQQGLGIIGNGFVVDKITVK